MVTALALLVWPWPWPVTMTKKVPEGRLARLVATATQPLPPGALKLATSFKAWL